MDKAQDIARLVESTISALGLELWGVEYAPRANNSLVRLYIDHAGREVTVDDCESVSREVSALFDVEDPINGHYTLEVSSPGLDRPFFKAAQLPRYAGETLEASLHAPVNGRRRIQGRLESVDGERVTLAVDGQPFSFDFAQAAKIRVKPDYAKLLAQPGRANGKAGAPGDTE
ncbi:ribosome maturation factor RimP [Pseudofulvimonas gallinarii]|jgi:ribosome maturation factor RimP|uniref:Ribosome maturation factor RimP n=1 Tax=Pseudofulvimonas gallinarii TaxID=634155 RepID=A0A4S3KRI8_9GAMM|nr:ribosome maturation factor RimP [Pseudofulvimonas gallinarii]TCT01415.1 ribosome maturation factor RimP [Pseudofulvimonas gallinarii]THD11682.1 ribosome maturation factor RimP [Pseudofulvimonas gallinarii]